MAGKAVTARSTSARSYGLSRGGSACLNRNAISASTPIMVIPREDISDPSSNTNDRIIAPTKVPYSGVIATFHPAAPSPNSSIARS
jgi:hypothetical protein